MSDFWTGFAVGAVVVPAAVFIAVSVPTLLASFGMGLATTVLYLLGTNWRKALTTERRRIPALLWYIFVHAPARSFSDRAAGWKTDNMSAGDWRFKPPLRFWRVPQTCVVEATETETES